MVWGIPGSIIYFILMVTLGVMSIRKGHWVMFIIGLFLVLLAYRRADAFAAARLLGGPDPGTAWRGQRP